MDINKIEKNSVIMFSGDSTTDCGRARPFGDYRTGFGDSYVKRIHEIYTSAYPEREIKFVNMGISGETSRQVRERWEADFDLVKPDYATVLIGVNDVWRHYDRVYDKQYAVEIDEYEDNLRYMAEYAKAHCKGFTIITPYFFELNKNDIFMKQVASYAAVCKKVAEETGCEFIDMQKEIDRLIKLQYTSFFSPDRVHPNAVTHMAIARYILKKWNFK